MNTIPIWQDSKKMALIGFVFTIPALILVTSGLLFSLNMPAFNNLLESIGFFELAHPVFILGGAAFGILLNLLPLVRFRFEDGALINTVMLKDHALNWGYLILAAGLLAVLFLYLMAESFQIFI